LSYKFLVVRNNKVIQTPKPSVYQPVMLQIIKMLFNGSLSWIVGINCLELAQT